ncbi:nitroreductase family protein [Microbacterium esteraromaticum]|uniref:nitroreductase family protein n=1 Tax=Microbacterium esteraromaticum TaxID=57043 RepID=UPI002367F7E7|nr:nitroreductase family protein [Microbacterium esteraromaticum]WDH78131.1 nitroreductase family protein [Microbacterium esteraromaticum]
MSAREAALARTSWSKVTEAAPTRDELVPLIEAAGRVADHSSLRPWRLIELRGDDRLTLGAALAEAAGDDKPSTKPLRASLLIAIVASYRKTDKVPRWEQEAVASGVAHTLSLLLDEAGWGVIWRTGGLTRAEAVARAHGLHENEELLGWLYVGGKPEGKSAGRRKPVDVDTVLTRMPDAGHEGDEQPPTSTDKKKSKKKTKKHKKKSKKD